MENLVEQATKLCSAVYRVTDSFPQQDPLRQELRKASLDILQSTIVFVQKTDPAKKDALESAKAQNKYLSQLCSVAQSLQWTDQFNFIVLCREYNHLCGLLEEGAEKSYALSAISDKTRDSEENCFERRSGGPWAVPPKAEVAGEAKSSFRSVPRQEILSERQKQLLQMIKKSNPAKVTDILDAFPKVNRRTMQRDFRFLEDNNFIKANGTTWHKEYFLSADRQA